MKEAQLGGEWGVHRRVSVKFGLGGGEGAVSWVLGKGGDGFDGEGGKGGRADKQEDLLLAVGWTESVWW